jgi:hypothetical protein
MAAASSLAVGPAMEVRRSRGDLLSGRAEAEGGRAVSCSTMYIEEVRLARGGSLMQRRVEEQVGAVLRCEDDEGDAMLRREDDEAGAALRRCGCDALVRGRVGRHREALRRQGRR